MMYQTSGAPGNRILTLEWKNWGFSNAGATSADFDLQIKLNEANNSIDIIYNPLLSNTETNLSPAGVVQVGLSGNTPADFNSRSTNLDWSASIPAVSVAPGVTEMTYSQTVRPIAGLLYSWTPGGGGCLPPLASPTTLLVNGIGDTYATVSFSPGAGSDGSLIVLYPSGEVPTSPSNGVVYSPGDPLALGFVVGNTVSNSVALSALTPSTSYDVYVYSQNFLCVGGPLFNIGPAFGSFTTASPPATTTWLGIAGGADNWQVPGNWTTGVPTSITTVTIPPVGVVPFPPNIATSGVVNSLILLNTAYINVGSGATLNVKGNLTSSNASIKGLGTAVFSGTGSQVFNGNLSLSNATFTNTSGLGVIIAVSAQVRIEPTTVIGTGIVTFGNSAKFTINGKFTLGSNITATARIGPIPTVPPNAVSITGDFTIERYLPNLAPATGSWYFLGSSVSGKNFTVFSDDFKVTGLTGGFGDQGGGIISSGEPERSSIFKYVESLHNVHTDTVQKNGWRIPGNELVEPGRGYRIFVNHQSNSSHKFDYTGPIVMGDFDLPLLTRFHYTPCYPSSPTTSPTLCNEDNRGWNLMANPYPCDIDWDSPGGWEKDPDMNDAFYLWDSQLGGYAGYAGGSGSLLGVAPLSGPNPNLIASSQGFFVRKNTLAESSVVLKGKETSKNTGSQVVFRRIAVDEENQMKICLTYIPDTDGYQFLSKLRIKDEATDGFDNKFDMYSLTGGRPSLTFPVAEELMLLNTIGPVNEIKTIPMQFNSGGQSGAFKFSFTDAESFSAVVVYLKDAHLNTMQEITGSPYTFEVDGSAGSWAKDRFELILDPDGVTSLTSIGSKIPGLSLYPNPSSSGKVTCISLHGFDSNTADLFVLDVMGKVVFKTSLTLNADQVSEYRLTEKLPAGVYTVKTTGGSKSLTRKLVIK